MAQQVPVQRLLDRVSELCESAFAAVEGLRGAAEQMLLPWSHGRPLRRADVEPMAQVVRPVLDAPGTPIVGAGLVLSPDMLSDARHWMEWWSRDAGGQVRKLRPVLDADADGFYDYTVLPWFVVPRENGTRHVTGPYVDWLCTEEYTLTFTVPLYGTHPERGRVYAGIVGADIVNSWVERRLLPLLHRAERPTALVNVEGRVVVSNQPGLAAGSVTHAVDVAGATLHPLDRLPLAVLQFDTP